MWRDLFCLKFKMSLPIYLSKKAKMCPYLTPVLLIFFRKLYLHYKTAQTRHMFSWLKKPEETQPLFQHRINVVSTLWINVEITLIPRWKWNKIRRRIFNVAHHWYNVSAGRWNNVGTTLVQRCFNLASTFVKTILNPTGLVMIMDLLIHE